MDLESIWKTFLEKIKNNINDISYETWFSEAQLIAIEDGIVKILVPSHVHKKNLKVNYIDLIEEKFTEVTGTNFKFEFFLVFIGSISSGTFGFSSKVIFFCL